MTNSRLQLGSSLITSIYQGISLDPSSQAPANAGEMLSRVCTVYSSQYEEVLALFDQNTFSVKALTVTQVASVTDSNAKAFRCFSLEQNKIYPQNVSK